MSDPDTELSRQLTVIVQDLKNTNCLNNFQSLVPVSQDFFTKHSTDSDPGAAHDQFFTLFGPLWDLLMNKKNYTLAEGVWAGALNMATQWEQENFPQLIHKGLAFYMWGGTAIFLGQLRKGFLFLHAAVDEDRRKHGGTVTPHTPALMFVTLDTRYANQILQPLLKEPTQELEGLLNSYRNESGSSLTLADFQTRYAQTSQVQEIVFILTYAVFDKTNLSQDFGRIRSAKEFGSQLCCNCLFDLCQVIEESIRVKNTGGATFIHHAQHLSAACGWPLSDDPLGSINAQRKNDFDACIQALLTNAINAGGRLPVSRQERDLWITYVLRNSGGHNLSARRIVYDHFDELYGAVVKTLFKVVDALY